MKRGELYRVRHPTGDPKRSRIFVVVSRDAIQQTGFPTVVCAPILTARHGLSSEVDVGQPEGLKHDSSIHCDALANVPRRVLTDYVGALGSDRLVELARALRVAISVECDDDDDDERERAERTAATPRRVRLPR